MARISLDLKGGWDKFTNRVDQAHFKNRLETNLGKATQYNGMVIRREIRKNIRSKKYEKNAALTSLIKGSTTPLIDAGDLWGAITTKNVDAYTLFIGVLKSTTTKRGMPMVNLVQLLHEGGTLQVTEHMRNMFILLAEVGEGKRDISTLEGRTLEIAKSLGDRISQIKPLKPTTTHIVIPPRPFIADVLKDKAILKKCEDNWRKAVDAALRSTTASSEG